MGEIGLNKGIVPAVTFKVTVSVIAVPHELVAVKVNTMVPEEDEPIT